MERPICEVCNEAPSVLEMDLNTDEESESVFWHVCAECLDKIDN